MDFTELGLSEKTIKAINDAGMSAPTTVQADVIPSILAGKDVFTIAPSRCGKTCSYVLPLIDIISRHEAKNILIITAGSKQSVSVSDSFAVFNKYHEINDSTITEEEEDIDDEANVIIASPNLLVDLMREGKVDLSSVDILVVDDINLIKKFHQLKNLQVILEALPADKQNIVFTNRRSKETQSILEQILKTPEEIKVDRDKEAEAIKDDSSQEETIAVKDDEAERPVTVKNKKKSDNPHDYEAINLMKMYRTFGRQTPEFLLTKVELVEDEE